MQSVKLKLLGTNLGIQSPPRSHLFRRKRMNRPWRGQLQLCHPSQFLGRR